MSGTREPHWKPALAASFVHLERTCNEHSLLVIAYLVLIVFATVASGSARAGELIPIGSSVALFSHLAALVVFQALSCDIIRRSWLEEVDEKRRSDFSMRGGGAPLLSLVFLHVLFVLITGFLFLFLIAPALWFMIKSSLASALVCVEDTGAVAGLRKSHQLVDGHFFQAAGFMVPVVTILVGPAILIHAGADYGVSMLADMSLGWIVNLSGFVAAALVKAVALLMSQLLVMGCLSKLFAHLNSGTAAAQEGL